MLISTGNRSWGIDNGIRPSATTHYLEFSILVKQMYGYVQYGLIFKLSHAMLIILNYLQN